LNAHAFAEHIRDALETGDDAGALLLRYVRSYAEAGMLTRDAGLVVRTEAGDEYQVTVVRVRRADDGEDDG
jgi:hypothetical protein